MTTRRSPSIRVRLALTFVSVAVVSVGLVATLAVVLGEHDLSTLAAQRRDELVRSLQAAAVSAYHNGTPGWSDADLQPALSLARGAGADAAILDQTGEPIASSLADVPRAAGAIRTPISIGGTQIGTLVVQFHNRGVQQSAEHLKRSLLYAVLAAAGAACLLSLLVAAVASRRLTRPVVQLITAARAIAAGDRTARVGAVAAPGEVRELTTDFDRMADMLVRQEQLQRDLVADVAHELRTPVAVLQASCEAILDEVRPLTLAEVSSLHEEVLRLSRLVDDLQALAAADAAALHLRIAPTDLGAIATAVADSLRPRFADGRINVQQAIESVVVAGDEHRLRQIVLNLLTNALKFTPADGTVRLTVRHSARGGELVVADSGVGIAADELPHVYERFWRGRSGAAAAGTGIGLAIVAELVQAHQGSIDIASAPDAGTTVTVALPLAR